MAWAKARNQDTDNFQVTKYRAEDNHKNKMSGVHSNATALENNLTLGQPTRAKGLRMGIIEPEATP